MYLCVAHCLRTCMLADTPPGEYFAPSAENVVLANDGSEKVVYVY